ncbi:MAG TPA: tetratricopeptide repeat protein [Longimicrobiales bacterium]|nr:tetratricopeptide repeat protein [Longimicrobiales bacterium]
MRYATPVPAAALAAMLLLALPGLLVPPAAVAQAPATGQQAGQAGGVPPEAREALRTGEYEEAIEALRSALERDPAAAEARVALIEALLATGAYEEAVTVGRAAPEPAAAANATGEALMRLGRWDEAEAAFGEAARAGGRWALTAEVNLAELLFQRGQVEEAMRRFDRFIDVYNAANGRLSAPDLVAVGRAIRYLGRDEPSLFQDALRAFDEAAAADPEWHEPRVRAGDLFLEKYDSPSAQDEYRAVLEVNPRHPGALFGLARAREFDGTADAAGVLDRLLEVDRNHVPGRALLAMRHLTNERIEEARAEAEAALEVDPRSLPALTALAGSYMLEGDTAGFERTRQRLLAVSPRWGEMDASLADLAVQTRRYEEAVERAQIAVELDPSAWTAWGLLGMNQLRLGRIEEGRANLERAFAGDPYNPWFKNSLDLLDTFGEYEVHETEHFALFLNGAEDDLLATYLGPLAEEAYDSLSRRYGVEPELPVRAELFPSHADFSVRTLGEAGLGALGVSFGRVLVMDSPGARQLGEYNWASVFWHELSHTFHLAATDNRVPRWFSEGLAMHEQRKARPNWGHQPSIPFVQALVAGRLKPVSQLNDGFMRPDYPEQVVFSYYEASLVFQLIEERWGFDAILAMLDGYRRGETTEEVMPEVLGMPLERFDEEFDAYMRERFRGPIAGLVPLGDRPGPMAGIPELEDYVRAHPGDFVGQLRLGAMLVREQRYDEAEPHLREALRIWPEYGEADSPYWYLAQIHRERGELEQAAAALERLNSLSEANYDALLMQADVLEELGRDEESAAALEKAVQVWPYEMDLHLRLAQLEARLGDHEAAVREREAIVALNPPDRAEALYQLAVAQRDAGDLAAARRSVLLALEIAPNYESALELLLDVRSGGGAAPR